MCYKCTERYILGHVCKQSHMHFILINDHEGTNEGQGEDNEEFYDYAERELSNEKIEGSIHALTRGSEHHNH